MIIPMRMVCARAAADAVAELGTKASAANALGVSMRTLYRLLRAAGVETHPTPRTLPMIKAAQLRRESRRVGKPVTWSGYV